MNNVHSRDGFYCELLLCLLISYNKFTLSNIGFLLTVDGNFRWQYKDLVACLWVTLYTVINTVKKGIPEHPPDKTYTLGSWFWNYDYYIR